jgi:hypothetical protein
MFLYVSKYGVYTTCLMQFCFPLLYIAFHWKKPSEECRVLENIDDASGLI